MNGRVLAERLLATTSVAALALALASPEAEASCATTVPAGGSYVNTGTVGCIAVTTNSVSVTNATTGVVGPSHGFIVVNSGVTLSGAIVNAGEIVNTASSGSALGIIVAGGLVQGGITNSGTISATGLVGGSTTAIAMGISVFGSSGFGSAASSFGGTISNSGTITAIANGTSAATAIGIGLRVSAFSGSIVNSGTISASGSGPFAFATGITASVASFSGSISNNGTIIGTAVDVRGGAIARGIAVQGTTGGVFFAFSSGFLTSAASSFGGSIVNSGMISLSATGFRAGAVGLYADVSTFSGGLTNGGTISVAANGSQLAMADGINVGTVTFGGSISNGGTIAVTADPPLGFAVGHGIIVHGTSGNFSTASFFGGSVVNSGSIALTVTANRSATATGISIAVSTFAGDVVNSGTISVASAGSGGALAAGIALYAGTYLGGITNNGTLSVSGTLTGPGTAHATGILLCDCVGPFSGGIVNGGTIGVSASGGATGIAAGISANSATLNGGVTSGGTITASASGTTFAHAVGIGVGLETTGSAFSVASFAGNVSNSGTVTASATTSGTTGNAQATGIAIGVSTFNGGIVNAGSIIATATSSGSGGAVAVGIAAGHTVFAGGITNSGTIIATATNLATATASSVEASGIRIAGFTFSGTVTNSGQIQATASIGGGGNAIAWGLFVDARTSFNGGITNSGSIVARSGGPGARGQATGLFIGSSTFTGNIVNSGTIAGLITAGGGTGRGVRFFCGAAISLTNTGTITGSTWGIDASQGNGATINQTDGLISGTSGGAILLSSHADVVNISGGAVSGNIQGGGAANIINVNMGAGTLSYAGQITNVGTVNLNSGTLLLQNLSAPGVSTVNYNQSGGSTLALEVSPAATNNHASLSASGAISLGAGSALELVAGPFAWTPGTYDFGAVITAGTITGSFASVTSNSPFFVPNLIDPVATLTLTVTMLSPSQVPGLDANQKSVANAIIGIPGGNATLDQLFTLSNPGPALTQLAAAQFTQTNYQPLIEAWQMFGDSLSDRLSQGGGYGGTVSARYDPGQGLQFAQANIPQVAQMSDAGYGGAPALPHQWGLWARGYGLSSTAPATATSSPYSESGAGLIVGADNQITDRIVAGAALNVSTDKATVSGGGFTQTTAYQGSAYGQYAIDSNWYVNGIAGFGWQTYKTARVVTLLGPGTDNGSFNGQSYRLYGESGYALHPAFMPQTRITPYLGLGYLHVHTDGFTETGGSTSALAVQAMDPNSFTTTLGARAAASFQIGATVFRPELRAAWQHEFLDDTATLRATFANVPGSPAFTAVGTSFGSDSFLGGAGMTTSINSSTQLFFDYDAKITGGYTAQVVSGGLRVQF